MKITNKRNETFRLPTGHFIPAGKSIDLPRSVIAHPDNGNYLSSLERSGKIVTGTAKAPPAPGPLVDPVTGVPTRRGLCDMDRPKLVALAAVKGVERDVYQKMDADALREYLAGIIFESDPEEEMEVESESPDDEA